MHNGARFGVAAVTVGMFAAGGYAAYALVGDFTKDPAPVTPKVVTVVAEAPSPEVAAQGAKAFLAAWAEGNYEEAGRHTDKPEAAIIALTAFRTALNPTAVSLTPGGPATSTSASGSPTPTGVPLTFRAKVDLAGATAPWQYDGTVAMVKMSDGRAVVHWDPSVVHPRLTTTAKTLAVQPITTPPSQVVDRKGRPLAEFPSLTALLGQVKFDSQEAPPPGDGTGIVVTQRGGTAKPEPLFTITEPKPGPQQPLTLDANLQRVAEAVARKQPGPASVVAIEPAPGTYSRWPTTPPTARTGPSPPPSPPAPP